MTMAHLTVHKDREGAFPSRFDSSQNSEIALTILPSSGNLCSASRCLPTSDFQSCVCILKIGFNLSHLTGLYNFLTVDKNIIF